MKPVLVKFPHEVIERIDAILPGRQSRAEWIRVACERRLDTEGLDHHPSPGEIDLEA